jgi:hypothetical protein
MHTGGVAARHPASTGGARRREAEVDLVGHCPDQKPSFLVV